MKANDFNVHNIKEKYNFKSSGDFLLFLKEQLKNKEEDKIEAQKLLDEIDINFTDSDLDECNQEFKDFVHKARKGALKRLDRINAGISALKQDIEIVKTIKDN